MDDEPSDSYKEDWVFQTSKSDKITIDFKNQAGKAPINEHLSFGMANHAAKLQQ